MSIQLPEVNTLVRVQISDDLILPSRVESVEGRELVLAGPRYVGNVQPPELGDDMAVLWTGERGICGLPAKFVAVERRHMTMWRVLVVGTVEIVQRRRYVRAPVEAPVTLSAPEVQSVRIGHMLDLGEGGLRVRMTRNGARPSEDVIVRLALDDTVVDVPGTILRVDPLGGGFEEAVVQFEEDHRQANAIRRFVFHEQARMRRTREV